MFIALRFSLLLVASCTAVFATGQTTDVANCGHWTEARTSIWLASHPWLMGVNYIPSTAENQLEMWQRITFDPVQIERECGWAEAMGVNSLRVFLHDLAWRDDPSGFLGRVDHFLAIADAHHIKVVFVLFDGVWDPQVSAGAQRAPIPGVHNSRWVQSPGAKLLAQDPRTTDLGDYVRTVIGRFKDDARVLAWDIFNEPDNRNNAYRGTELPNKMERSLVLLRAAFMWAREAKPIQPLTCAVWQGNWNPRGYANSVADFALANSDIITFHWYGSLEETRAATEALLKFGRPVLCTEYLARSIGSRFETILPYFKQTGVGAFNWGFVAGKTQTQFPWDSWDKPYTAEPAEWHHDILRGDGTPFRTSEVELIRALTFAGDLFGSLPDGRSVHRFWLRNAHGVRVSLLDYGATLASVETPDRHGRLADVTLGYDSFSGWLSNSSYFGATVGRYANRIAGGKFSLDNQSYTLATNNVPGGIACHLHGGIAGFDKNIWSGKRISRRGAEGVEFQYVSRAGEEGYPGTLSTNVTYWLSDNDCLRVEFAATTDAPTVVNLANHTYWNLSGCATRTILDHELTLAADAFLPVDIGLIPTGERRAVAGTPFDFTKPTAIGQRINETDGQLNFGKGYDHCWILSDSKGLRFAARLRDPDSGRCLELFTDQPGIQFYSGNFLDGTVHGKGGTLYGHRSGVVLETERFPDSPNQPTFPSATLRPGETYRHVMEYRFSIR